MTWKISENRKLSKMTECSVVGNLCTTYEKNDLGKTEDSPFQRATGESQLNWRLHFTYQSTSLLLFLFGCSLMVDR